MKSTYPETSLQVDTKLGWHKPEEAYVIPPQDRSFQGARPVWGSLIPEGAFGLKVVPTDSISSFHVGRYNSLPDGGASGVICSGIIPLGDENWFIAPGPLYKSDIVEARLAQRKTAKGDRVEAIIYSPDIPFLLGLAYLFSTHLKKGPSEKDIRLPYGLTGAIMRVMPLSHVVDLIRPSNCSPTDPRFSWQVRRK